MRHEAHSSSEQNTHQVHNITIPLKEVTSFSYQTNVPKLKSY